MGSVAAILLGAVAGWRHGANRVMLATAGAIIGAQSFYWFSGGPDFGARYWVLIIVPCAALTATGIERLATGGDARERSGTRSGPWHIAAAALTVMAMVTFVPWRALDKYFHWRGMRADGETIVRDRRVSWAAGLDSERSDGHSRGIRAVHRTTGGSL